MAERVTIIGIAADGAPGLPTFLREQIDNADFLAGGARHLAFFPQARGERFIVGTNLEQLAAALRQRLPEQRCVVLASGDPLFYGIGRYLCAQLGRERVAVEPAVSSMQLAFARAGVPWQDADLASVHGRDLRAVLLPLMGKRIIGLFTQDGDSPAAVARFLLERQAGDYEAFVGEALGAPAERCSRWPDLTALSQQAFASLNYLILQRRGERAAFAEVDLRRALVPGVPDDVFLRPEQGPEVMTRQEVRAVVLAKLGGPWQAGDVCWDIGAGLGTVAVELAVLRPAVEVVAVEGDPSRADYLRRNRERFGAYNVRVVPGTAPAALLAETERPRWVFVGGSGGQLGDILELARARLCERGVLLANFVTLEHMALTLQRLAEWGWPCEVTEVHVARSDHLAGLTGLKPQRGVFLIRTEKRA